MYSSYLNHASVLYRSGISTHVYPTHSIKSITIQSMYHILFSLLSAWLYGSLG